MISKGLNWFDELNSKHKNKHAFNLLSVLINICSFRI